MVFAIVDLPGPAQQRLFSSRPLRHCLAFLARVEKNLLHLSALSVLPVACLLLCRPSAKNTAPQRFRRKDKGKVSLKTMERYLKHVSVPTLCWTEIRSQAGLRHLDLSDNLTDQEYDRIIEVRVASAYFHENLR